MRIDKRKYDELRKITITKDYLKHPQGSVLIEFGDTKVICTAMIEEKVPPFLRNSGRGWITAEYSMLPAANPQRKQRDIGKLKLDGRSAEIQRLIGRSLRSVVDLNLLGERTIWIDCDVIQADGGTRCASICGGFVAMYDAVLKLIASGNLKTNPITTFASAVSVGIGREQFLLDLCYAEDSTAIADVNVVMTEEGSFIEIQATGEARPITENEMVVLLSMAKKATKEIIEIEKKALGLV